MRNVALRMRARAWSVVVVAVVVPTLFAACATRDKITLLPNPDGTVGALVVKSGDTTKTIDKPYERVEVSSRGSMDEVVDNPSNVQTQYGALLAAQPPRPMTFTINFVFDSATQLAPESTETVARLKAVLVNWPAPHLTVVGHTDLVGNDTHNDRLSMQRAQTVAAFLIKAGIPAKQIETAGRGKREPLVHTADGVPNQMNRRAVITIQ